MQKIAIFASGSGSNAQKIMEHFAEHPLARVEMLISNRQKAYALVRAQQFGVKALALGKEAFQEGQEVLSILQEASIDWIVLAGFLLKIPEILLEHYPERMLNIHPSLLPKFGGKGMYGMHVHRAVLDAGEKESGISIHYVNKFYDEGKIILQEKCPVMRGDTPEMLAHRVLELEHRYFPKVLEELVKKSAKNP